MFELTPFVKRNHVTTYDPFRLFDEMERSFFKGSELGDFRADIRDTGDAYELEADLPGVKKEDIKVDIEGGVMTISAERHSDYEDEDKKKNYIRKERSYGTYKRSFDISEIDESGITASYEDGLLKLILPKKQAAVPESRRLEIK